jgi:hypothetical protein
MTSFTHRTRVRIGTKSFGPYRAAVTGRPACTATITYVVIAPGDTAAVEVPSAVHMAFSERQEE